MKYIFRASNQSNNVEKDPLDLYFILQCIWNNIEVGPIYRLGQFTHKAKCIIFFCYRESACQSIFICIVKKQLLIVWRRGN